MRFFSLLSIAVCYLAFGAIPVYADIVSNAAANLSTCPGYAASNIVKTSTGLTATLRLAGTACNTYGKDLDDLRLLVEYQTGMFLG